MRGIEGHYCREAQTGLYTCRYKVAKYNLFEVKKED